MSKGTDAIYQQVQRTDSEQFRALVENVLDYAIFMLDAGGYVTSWNLGAQRIKGYTAGEAIGMHFSRFYPAEAVARGWPAHELNVARLRGRFEDEGWRIRKDGTQFWANVIMTAVRDEHGAVRGFVKITRDMTERRRTLALEASHHRMDEFIAMLGHELRNPLGVIHNTAGVVEEHSSDDTLRLAADMLKRQVHQLGRLVEDLLDVARIRSGKLHLREARFDLAALVREAVANTRASPEGRERLIETSIEPDTLYLLGDEVRIAQALGNVLGNAVKYTQHGGHIAVRFSVGGDEACISVQDDGAGISADMLQEIFAPFTQGHRTLDRSQGGLGIGLTVARRIVELHGGLITAFSRGIDMGSEFTIRLPIVQANGTGIADKEKNGGRERFRPGRPPASSADVVDISSARKRRRVLVVDDNHDAADSLAMLLRLDGFETTVAYSGNDALAAFERQPSDVVVLDIGLPGLDGYEVASRLRALARSAPLTLIALTGYGQDKDRERSQGSGFQHHLVKPVDYDSLRRILNSPPA